ncbi:MAG TPA: ABC transporter substrate-binding protein, partial [Candidatus Tectomicrobia bacterium]|nr:ABC transporter substrate-binding protein [Candidatus Tectomicrobia bacterium]
MLAPARRLWWSLLWWFLLAAASLVAPAPAQAGSATDRLRDLFAAVNTILAAPETREAPESALDRIRALIADACDIDEAAATALGAAWSARTPAERDEFVRIFHQVLERAYLGRLAGVASVSGGVRVTYLGESVHGDAATVRTTVVSRDGQETPVDYRMVRRDGRWLVRDLVMDGVSVVENYRAQFQRLLRQGSYATLLAYLKTRFGLGVTRTAASPAADAIHAARPGTAAHPAADATPVSRSVASVGSVVGRAADPTTAPRSAIVASAATASD